MLTKTVEQTKKAAGEIWRTVEHDLGERAIIIALEGDLGAGKTVFTKGLYQTLGIQKEAVSPTFVLHISHPIPNSNVDLEHIDAWRMERVEELEQLNLNKMVEKKSVIVIEWSDRFRETIYGFENLAKIVWVKMGYGENKNQRTLDYSSS